MPLCEITSILLGKKRQAHIGEDARCINVTSCRKSLYVELESEEKRLDLAFILLRALKQLNKGLLELTRYIFPPHRMRPLYEQDMEKEDIREELLYNVWGKELSRDRNHNFVRY